MKEILHKIQKAKGIFIFLGCVMNSVCGRVWSYIKITEASPGALNLENVFGIIITVCIIKKSNGWPTCQLVVYNPCIFF